MNSADSAKESFGEKSFQIAAAMDDANQINSVLQGEVEEENLLKST